MINSTFSLAYISLWFVLLLIGLASGTSNAQIELTPAQRAALKATQLNKSFACDTPASGIQGCWDVPQCTAFGETSYRKIIEFTADQRFIKHHIHYGAKGCRNADILYINAQTGSEGWLSIYKTREETRRQGQRIISYPVIFFSDQPKALTGELVTYNLKGDKLCFFPSQITKTDFSIKDDELSRRWPKDAEYFLSGQFLREMTACLARANPV